MDNIPLQTILLPLLALAAVGFTLYQRTIGVKNQEKRYARYRASELAKRLGLRLVEGDPNFNFLIQQANVDVKRGPRDRRPIHISIRLQGSRHDMPIELAYFYRVEQTTGFTEVVWTTWFECRLSVYARQSFSPFEISSRKTPAGLIVERYTYPEVQTGNSQIDATYRVSTETPAMGALLGERLPPFAAFSNAGVHLIGDGAKVSYMMEHSKPPLLGNVLDHAESAADLLVALVRRLDEPS